MLPTFCQRVIQRRMGAPGFSQGTSHNTSIRHGEGMLIAPTGVAYYAMNREQIVLVATSIDDDLPPIEIGPADRGSQSSHAAGPLYGERSGAHCST
ncbi:MAG: class II aldolase/adducin family protein [Bradyrhizobium sp.]|nr:class II aldolase/adducin family protein [Bradyrhizobium sp.]